MLPVSCSWGGVLGRNHNGGVTALLTGLTAVGAAIPLLGTSPALMAASALIFGNAFFAVVRERRPFRKEKAMTMLNTTPRYAVPTVRGAVAVFLARLGHLVNRVIAAAIAHRERQANLVALRHLSDRDLKDIGIYHCEIGDALVQRAQDRQRIQQSQRS
jgi:uncharacterized protein YjiS (DUF1127 family)